MTLSLWWPPSTWRISGHTVRRSSPGRFRRRRPLPSLASIVTSNCQALLSTDCNHQSPSASGTTTRWRRLPTDPPPGSGTTCAGLAREGTSFHCLEAPIAHLPPLWLGSCAKKWSRPARKGPRPQLQMCRRSPAGLTGSQAQRRSWRRRCCGAFTWPRPTPVRRQRAGPGSWRWRLAAISTKSTSMASRRPSWIPSAPWLAKCRRWAMMGGPLLRTWRCRTSKPGPAW
mmetsp:Transcript_126184/g.218605  ORF Transcript_126184/g.218605 Transcript_126184/m.218605 type:complete len:228 (+) Transcript_126184:811-1494(+)